MKIKLFSLIVLITYLGFSQMKSQVVFEPQKTYSQELIDSLILDPEIPLRMSELRKILESDSTLLGWPHYYYGMTSILFKEVKYDSTIYYANLGIKSYENSVVKRPIDERTLIVLYYFKGKALRKLKDSYNAILALQNGLELTKRHDYKWKSYLSYDIANTYQFLGDYNLALKYLYKNTKDSLFMTRESFSTYSGIGNLYNLEDKPDSSLYYYNKALKISLDSDDTNDILGSYLNLGTLYKLNRKKDSAISYFKKASDFHKNRSKELAKDQYLLAYATKIHRSYELLLNNNNQEIINFLPEVLDSLNKTVGNRYTKAELDLLIFANDYLGRAHINLNDHSKGLHYLDNKTKLLKTYNRQIQDEKIEQLEIQYQTKEKDASIAQLEQNKQQQETIIQQQRIITFGLGGLLLLLGGLGYVFWRQRKLKNQYEKENLEQRLLRSQMNPHFVFNALNSVAGLVQKKSEQTIPYIHKLAALFRLVLTNSREEFVSLEDELVVIKNYLELQSNFSKDFDFEIQVDENIDKESLIIPPMLIQPFIENAIIHGLSKKIERGNIKVHIKKEQQENLLFFKISDNGIGYEINSDMKIKKKHKSISGDIVTERLAILKKKFKVNTRFNIFSKLDSGTSIELYLPYLVD